MARQISPNFLDEFLNGSLKYILDYVHKDDTLDMELRGKEVTIYYRGGKLFSIKEDKDVYKLLRLDKKYTKPLNEPVPDINNIEDYIQKAKHIMDVWFVRNRKWERELQQQIIIENNYSPTAKDTDYFILDIEYKDTGRADIVALRWNSTRKDHKSLNTKLTIFELKQGYGSIGGDSSIVKHYNDFITFTSDPKKVANFKDDMIKVFAQKRKLGLIPYLDKNLKNKEIQDVGKEIDFIVILANYKSASTQLSKTDIKQLNGCKFMFANGMGYGLFSKNIVDLNGFLERFILK